MADIIHRIGIASPASRVFAALTSISGLAQWWTEDTTGRAAAGGTITFTFRKQTGEEIGKMAMEVLEQNTDTHVQWNCVDGPPDWIGTEITFDLSVQDGITILVFGHRHWREASEFMAHCSMKWATFLLSLRSYVETGTGAPSPNDLKIDNWN